MNKSLILSFFFLLITFSLTAQNKIEINSSKISFEIKNAGLNVTGSLKGLKADVWFSPDALDKSAIKATVDVKTIDTGIGLRDKDLQKEKYFDVDKYPLITMSSTKIERNGVDKFKGLFNLTIKGKTKTIEMPFNYAEKGNTATFKGSFKINRLDFDVGNSNWILADDVKVSIEASGIISR